MSTERKVLNINGLERAIVYNPETESLAESLRKLGLTGTKLGCKQGLTGAGHVLLSSMVS